MAFYRGQKVIYIGFTDTSWRHRWNRFWHPYNDPEIDRIYTVAQVIPFADGDTHLELVEYESGDLNYWSPGFQADGFRPVVERRTDIGFAHEILRKVTKRQGIDA